MQTKLSVPFAEKDQAKALGARFNMSAKYWYVPDGIDITPFRRWLSKDLGRWLKQGKRK